MFKVQTFTESLKLVPSQTPIRRRRQREVIEDGSVTPE